ncbi:PLP-dependent aminotransferase family protein [Acidaminococcus fermentans]|jgi:2-aminoadipate transaminase|uniref:aminotransferase-like domain-containing protein n=1 Tax=Acidaminococcus fermentans TaxID=905 RepID=UPI00242C3701|nr:PLP-dependent aminotransferase family protein [Acidaminococcus fermentans]MEE1598772.1 PLP-dependent aminotransferase family protein [Acidaminococcus fermentans]MEE4123034.1 PLP-dependent aminotransferase family protein [Acidaminococcus fermentans]
MEYKFAKRMAGMQASAVREILKVTQRPEVISFAGGLPAPELFPVEEIGKVCQEVCAAEGRKVLQYATTEGRPTLRAKIADRMNRKYKSHLKAENILITTGSQQNLDMAGKIFFDEGDVVLMESPTYLAAINAFKAYQPVFKEVPTDEKGMIPEELDKILAETPRAKLIYVIPDFQNPTGICWSLERRQKFMEIVNKYNIPVLEDNPYGELRYEGETLPSLQSMDTKDLVMAMGTFSKTFCPGLRIGWLAAPITLMKEFVKVKQSADLHTSAFDQAIIDRYMDEYSLDDHVAEINKLYKHRRDLLLKTMEETFTDGTTWTHPEGGLFLWLTFPEGVSARKVFDKCIEKNVAGVLGEFFYPNIKNDRHMRINYSNMPDDRIVEGVKRMAEALKEIKEGK